MRRVGGRRPPGPHPAACGDDDRDRDHDDRAGHDCPEVDRLAEDERAEDDRHDRVDVGVGRDQRQWRDPQQPAVHRERDEAAQHEQVDAARGRIRARRPRGSNVANSPVDGHSSRARTRPPSTIWTPVATSGRRGSDRAVRGEQRSGRPGDGREHDQRGEADAGRAPRCRRCADGPTRMAIPTNPRTMPTTARRGQALTEEDAAEDGDPDRHHRDHQGGDPRRDRLLADTRPCPSRRRAAARRRSRCRAIRVGSGRDERAALAGDRPGQQDEPGQAGTGPPPSGTAGSSRPRPTIAEVGRAPDEVEDQHPEPRSGDRRGGDRRGRRLA